MKKSTLFLIILTAIFFTSTLVLIYLNYLKPQSISTPTPSSTPTESISPTPDPTANWKTYENKEYGFSFKYPTNFQPSSQIQIIDNSDQLTVKQYSDNLVRESKNDELCPGCYRVINEEKYSIGVNTALLQEVVSHPIGRTIKFLVSNKNKIIILRGNSIGDSDTPTSDSTKEEFLKILSTFKFTQSSSQKTPAIIPNGWKYDSYFSDSGNQKSFTIAYPSDWFFGIGGPIFFNYDPNNPNIQPVFRSEDVKCDVYDSESSDTPVLTNIIEIAKETNNSYKIIRGNHTIDISGGVATTYQLSAQNKILAYVVCFAFTDSDAKTVDQIVKTIRY